MADVLLEYNGKRFSVSDDSEKYDRIMATPGVKVVEEDVYGSDGEDGESKPFDRNQEMQDAARESERELGISASEQDDSPRGKLDKALTFVQGAGRSAGFGLDEKGAGVLRAIGGLPIMRNPITEYERGKSEQEEANRTAMEVAPGPMIAGGFTGDVAQLATGLKKSPIGAAPGIVAAGKAAAKPAALAMGASGVAAGDGVAESAILGAGGAVLGGAGGFLLGAGGKVFGDKASRALAMRKAGKLASGGVDVAESLPGVGGPIKAVRKVAGELSAAETQTLDDFVRTMSDEQVPASLRAVDPPAPRASPAPSLDDAASGVDDATKALSPQEAAAQSLDEVDGALAPKQPKGVTPTDPTVIKQRTPTPEAPITAESMAPSKSGHGAPSAPVVGEGTSAARRNIRVKPLGEAPAPRASEAQAAKHDPDMAEVQRMIKETQLGRTPEEWATATDAEKIAAIKEAAALNVAGRRLPNSDYVRGVTGLDKKDFARLYPEVRASLIPPKPVKPPKPTKETKAPKTPKAKAKSPVEAAADDIDELDAALGGSPIESAVPPPPSPSGPLPDPDLVTAFLQQGHSKEKAVEMALAVMAKKPAEPAMRTRFEPSSQPAPKKRPSTAKKRPTFDGKK